MAQPPSFPFYVGDWIAGTATLSLEAKGAYIDCLAHQWGANEGVPGDDPVALSRIIRGSKSDAKRLWLALTHKFQKQPDGTYKNARLEHEREAKARYYEAKRRNGEKGGRPRFSETGPQGRTETKPTGYPPSPSPSPSPSVPTEQRDAREIPKRPRMGDPFGMRLDPNAAATLFLGDERTASIPASWATKARAAYRLTSADIDAFASWLSVEVQQAGGVIEDGGKRLPWLDARLADWRAERAGQAASDASVQRGKDWDAKMQAACAAADADPLPAGVTVRDLVRQARARG